MSNPPPMIKNVDEVIDRMGLSEKTITNMVPTDFLDPEVCTLYGIETMEDVLTLLEQLGEEEEDDAVVAYQMIPVESKVQTKHYMITSDTSLTDKQQRGQFWCNKDIGYVPIEACMVCTPFFDGYNKITCVLTCNYKFSM